MIIDNVNQQSFPQIVWLEIQKMASQDIKSLTDRHLYLIIELNMLHWEREKKRKLFYYLNKN